MKRGKNQNLLYMSKNLFTIIASVAISSLAAFGIVKAATPDNSNRPATSGESQTVRAVNLSLTDYPDFTFAAEYAVEAVVYVEVTVQQSQQYQMIDPFFQFFFGNGMPGQPQTREQKSSGSGVIIRQDGYIVTNNHVVANATKIEVTLNNNKTYPATVIGTDPATDVALIKIDAVGLPILEFADSDKLRLGEWVLAIGSPLGRELQSTITAGIVSAKGRSMPSENREFKIESFIQTDAAVNPGNSGGALVTKEGKLVGINTAIVSTTGSFTGYSFAVPSNIVAKIVSDLIDFGSVQRAMLGITGGTLNEELAKELKLSASQGVYVNEVVKGGTADKAGIKEKDVIVGLDSTKIVTMSDLQAKVNGYHPGDKALLKYIRGEKTEEVQLVFQGMVQANGTVDEEGMVSFYGAKLKGVEGGVEIVSAGSGKMAAAGAEDGFVIRYVNDQKVSKPQDVIDIAKKARRTIVVEGVTATGRQGYFAFGKDE